VAGPPPGSSAVTGSSSSGDAGYDMRRAFFTALFGATFVGPVGHFWYQAIDQWCKALVPKGGPAFIAAKVLLDTAAMGPFYVAGEDSITDITAQPQHVLSRRSAACMHRGCPPCHACSVTHAEHRCLHRRTCLYVPTHVYTSHLPARAMPLPSVLQPSLPGAVR
jgi:hypothetical protein